MVFILLLIGFLTVSSVSADDLSNLDISDFDLSEDKIVSDISVDNSFVYGGSIKSSNLKSSDLKDDLDGLNSNLYSNSKDISDERSAELVSRINNAQDNDIILIEPGTYKIHNVTLAKNITLQGKGYNEVIFDGEYLSSIFLINSLEVYANFYNLTFIHGLSENFGGGICIETGNAEVNNCVFINNSALNVTNGGAISNYGNEDYRSYLLINNSVFIGNHADHDGGAVTTCYARSDIYNSVFMNNSARRDGGAIRVSVFGYGFVQDCVFMYNHADEWAGAYYSWAGNSSVDRCIFMNNTAGTNGGAIMISGSANVTNNIIVNNTADLTGGSFYIQQPMFNATTIINVNNNIITNNTAPLGKEIYYKWNATHFLFPDFNKNYWEDENPADSSIIDPDNVTSKSRPKTKIALPNLFETLRFDLLGTYSDIIDDYFGNNKNDNANANHNDSGSVNKSKYKEYNKLNGSNGFFKFNNSQTNLENGLGNNQLSKLSKNGALSNSREDYNSTYVSPSSDVHKMVELIEENPISLKTFDMRYFIVLAIVLLTFFVGLLKRRDRN